MNTAPSSASRVRSFLFLVILLTVPLSIRFFWALQFAPVPFLIPDESIYPYAGRLYVRGVASGNLSVFAVNAEHPPLSKLVTGLFVFLMVPLGFSDVETLRIQSCFFSALTCTLAYMIGSRANRQLGLLSWLLLSLDPLSIRFSIASLDVTSLFFSCLSIYIFLRAHPNHSRSYLASGICLGLASLCKYIAYPMVLGTMAFVSLAERTDLRLALNRILMGLVISIGILVVGNPLFWPAQLTGFSGYEVFLEASRVYGIGPLGSVTTSLDWLELVLRARDAPYAMFYLSMFTHWITVYPIQMFQSSYLPWILLASLLYLAARRQTVTNLSLRSLLWFSLSFIVLWLLAKSHVEPYYAVWLQPPLALFSAGSILQIWRKLKR